MNLTGRTLRGGAWQFFMVVAESVMQLLVLAVLARYVLPKEFGLIAIAGIATSFVNLFAEMGLGQALVQRKEVSSLHIRVTFTASMLLGILVFLVVWILADPIAVFFQQPEVIDILPVIGLSLPISSFGLTAQSLLHRNLEFKKLTYANLGAYFLGYAPVGIAMAMLGYGSWALVFALISKSLLRSLILFASNPHTLRPSLASTEFRELFTFGGGHTLSKLFNFVALKGDYFVVGRGLGAEALGLYERIFRIMQLPGQYLGQVIYKVLFPAMALIQDQPAKLGKVYFSGIGIVNNILFPSSVLLIILAHELVLILLGPNWLEAVLPLQILFASVSLRSTIGLSDSLSRAVGAVYKSASFRAIYAFCVISGSWVGHFWGIVGVAIGTTFAMLIHYSLMARLSLSIIEHDWLSFLKEYLPGLRLGAITLIIAIPLTALFRLLSESPLLVFGSTVVLVGTVVCGIIMLFPQILGSSSLWVIERLLRDSPLGSFKIFRFFMLKLIRQ